MSYHPLNFAPEMRKVPSKEGKHRGKGKKLKRGNDCPMAYLQSRFS